MRFSLPQSLAILVEETAKGFYLMGGCQEALKDSGADSESATNLPDGSDADLEGEKFN